MAITKSAKKAHRASLKKRVFNLRRRDALTDSTKAFKKAVAAKDAKGAAKLLPAAYQAIDKAAKTNVIPKNILRAARRRSSPVALARIAA